MSRRRYLSTNISTDRRVALLGEQAGPWAVVIFTWCIPHASDDATFAADPEELLSQVAPNLAIRGLVSLADVARCIEVALSLALWVAAGEGRLRYPKSFHEYQTYIPEDRRGMAHPTPPPPPASQPLPVAKSDSATAPASAEPRESAQNTSSSSFNSRLSLTAPPEGGARLSRAREGLGPDAATPRAAPTKAQEPQPLRPEQQQCPLCPEVFPDNSALREHLDESPRHKVRPVADSGVGNLRFGHQAGTTVNPSIIQAELEAAARARAEFKPSTTLLAEHERLLAKSKAPRIRAGPDPPAQAERTETSDDRVPAGG